MVDQLRRFAARVVTGLALVALLTGAFPSSGRYPAFVPPLVNGTIPNIFADTTTEGASNHYWYLGKQYNGFSAWLTAISGTFSRTASAYYTNSSGVLTLASTGVPRFDYDPISLQSKGLLLEGSTTNLTVHSQGAFNSWSSISNLTITDNTVAAPDGTTTASLLAETNANGEHKAQNGATLSSTSAGGSFSVFAKANQDQFVAITLQDSAGGYFAVVADLVNGIITKTQAGGGVTAGNFGIIRRPNGWFRVWGAASTFNNTTNNINVQLSNSGTPTIGGFGAISYAGNTGNGAWFWGAQVENHSFITSYVVTTTGTASRDADAVTATPISGWYNAASGVLYAAADTVQNIAGAVPVEINDGSQNNEFDLIFSAGSSVNLALVSGGGVSSFAPANTDAGQTPNLTNVLGRAAVSATANSFAYVRDGGVPDTDSSGPMPVSPTSLTLGNLLNGSNLFGHLGQFGYWPTTATTGQLQALTAPPSWVPTALGVLPPIFADFAGQNYLFNGYVVPSLALWESATGAVFSRGGATPTFVGSNGLIQNSSTNVLRFDYDPNTLLPKGALIESAVTNFAFPSNNWGSTWTLNAVTLGSSTTSPDGTANGQKIQEDNTNNVHAIFESPTPGAGQATLSAYFHPAERTAAILRVLISGSTGSSISCGLSGAGSTTVLESGGSNSGRIVQAGNGWYRCSMTYTSSGGADTIEVGPNNGSNVVYTGITGDGVFAYGAQLENANFVSSYVPTTSGSASRQSDVLTVPLSSITSATFLGKTNGVPLGSITGAQRIFNASSADAPLFVSSNTQVGSFDSSAGSIVATPGSGTYGGKVASAVSGSGSGRTVAANQGSTGSDANPLFSTPAQHLLVGTDGGTGSIEADMYAFGYWPLVATGTQLQALSAP